MKTKLTLNPVNGGAFNCRPSREIELEDEYILCNDVMLPHDRSNPHNVRLWVVGNEFGALCAVWASHEQDALDEACDAGLLAGLAVDESEGGRVVAYLPSHFKDAPLLCAAPELLEALEALLARVMQDQAQTGAEYGPSGREIVDQARAAINKARGIR